MHQLGLFWGIEFLPLFLEIQFFHGLLLGLIYSVTCPFILEGNIQESFTDFALVLIDLAF
jgi:hypothetical protein